MKPAAGSSIMGIGPYNYDSNDYYHCDAATVEWIQINKDAIYFKKHKTLPITII